MKFSTINEQVYNIIKKEILEGDIKQGEWLQEKKIAERFNVSRSPTREALKKLAAEGLVENIPNKGVFVREIGVKEIEDIFEFRMIVEKFSIEKTINKLDALKREALNELLERLVKAFENKNKEEYTKIDAELHNSIVRFSGNNEIYKSFKNIYSVIQFFRSVALYNEKRFNESYLEHKNMITSILDQDFEKAWEWNLTHLKLAKKSIMKFLINKEEKNKQMRK